MHLVLKTTKGIGGTKTETHEGFTPTPFRQPADGVSSDKMSERGFTLIELLVVISIIGLLASVVLVSLNGARVKARNTKRLADTKQLVTAFNMALNDNGSLPSSAGGCFAAPGWVCVSDICSGYLLGGWGSWPACPATGVDAVNNFLAPYLSKRPSDPQDGHVRQADPSGVNSYMDGYYYNSGRPTTTAPNGTILPPGAYLLFNLELPYSSGMCGSAILEYPGDNPTNWKYVTCSYKLD